MHIGWVPLVREKQIWVIHLWRVSLIGNNTSPEIIVSVLLMTVLLMFLHATESRLLMFLLLAFWNKPWSVWVHNLRLHSKPTKTCSFFVYFKIWLLKKMDILRIQNSDYNGHFPEINGSLKFTQFHQLYLYKIIRNFFRYTTRSEWKFHLKFLYVDLLYGISPAITPGFPLLISAGVSSRD